jgi:hypothetical protein
MLTVAEIDFQIEESLMLISEEEGPSDMLFQ